MVVAASPSREPCTGNTICHDIPLELAGRTYRGVVVVHMANNAVADWWNARSRATLPSIQVLADSNEFDSVCDWKAGMIVRVMITGQKPATVTSGGKPVSFETRREFGEEWL